MSAPREHRYSISITWTGNRGLGTAGYQAYDRTFRIEAVGKLPILGSSDPAFRGDSGVWNPEELLVASLAACHQLWYLHLAADAGISVVDYVDRPEGMMIETAAGGAFEWVELRPHVTLAAGADLETAIRLHEAAHDRCFIANSVRFPVRCKPAVVIDRRSPG